MKPLRDWKIRNKIIVAPAIKATIMTIWVIVYLLPLFEKNILKEKQAGTRHVVEVTWGLLSEMDARSSQSMRLEILLVRKPCETSRELFNA